MKAKEDAKGKAMKALRLEEQVFRDKIRSEIENVYYIEINEIHEK